MTHEKKSLVFFGSGPVAAKSLELLQESFTVEHVITKPATVRDMESITRAPVHSAGSKAELDTLMDTLEYSSDVAVLIDFGIIVSEHVMNSFDKGIVNSHFSLLPKLRGADPISFAILEGLDETGVSLMLLSPGMDEGDIIVMDSTAVLPSDTSTTLTDKLIRLSDQLLKSNLEKYLHGTIHATTQEELCRHNGTPYEPTYTRKLSKEDGVLNLSKSAIQLEREIRAFIEWPKSRTTIGGIDVILKQATVIIEDHHLEVGTIFHDIKAGVLKVATSDGWLDIKELQPAGKKAMQTKQFLLGYSNRL